MCSSIYNKAKKTSWRSPIKMTIHDFKSKCQVRMTITVRDVLAFMKIGHIFLSAPVPIQWTSLPTPWITCATSSETPKQAHPLITIFLHNILSWYSEFPLFFSYLTTEFSDTTFHYLYEAFVH